MRAPPYTSLDCIRPAEPLVFKGPFVFRSVLRISSHFWNDKSQNPSFEYSVLTLVLHELVHVYSGEPLDLSGL